MGSTKHMLTRYGRYAPEVVLLSLTPKRGPSEGGTRTFVKCSQVRAHHTPHTTSNKISNDPATSVTCSRSGA